MLFPYNVRRDVDAVTHARDRNPSTETSIVAPVVQHHRRWERLVSPSPAVEGVADRMRARMLAAFCLVLLPVGLLSAFVQWLVVPDFDLAFVEIAVAVAVMSVAYGLARTRYWYVAAHVAAVIPVVMSIAVGWTTPHDRIWYAFMILGVMFGGVFVSARYAAVLTALGTGGILLVSRVQPAFSDPALWIPALFFFVGFSLLFVIAVGYRDRIEAARRRVLMDAQAVMARAQRLETVAQLSAGLAHDFNNLLSALYGIVDELEHGDGVSSEALADLKSLAKRASDLTRKIAAIGRREVTRTVPVDLGAALVEIEPILERICLGEGVRLVFERRVPAGPWVLGDVALVEQIVFNLVANARNASRAGQDVRVTVDVEADEAVVRVADHGVGIAERDLQRIFEPFVSLGSAKEGSGLGLAVVRRFTEELGGTVRVRSAPGEGAVFEVRLPVVDPPAAEAGPAGDPAEAQRPRGLLVVDDEPIIARSVGRMVEQLGFEAAVETTPQAALEKVTADPQRYAVLVTDVSMPGMSGGVLAERVKAVAPHVRVLFVSGQPEDTLAELGVAASPLNFLAKPFTKEQLAAKIRVLVG